MAEVHRKHGGIIMDALERRSLKKLDSFDDMGGTYVSPDQALRINGHGVRGPDGAYVGGQVDPAKLVVLEELGRGASAVVKRAALQGSSSSKESLGAAPREYVVKCFNIHDAPKRRMLREELKLLLAMSSTSVVGFYGAYLDIDRKVSVVLEFMDRGSIEDLWAYTRQRRIVIPEQALCGVAYQVVLGLDYLNDHGFLHRDVKPPNLLMNSAGEVKLADFGIGRQLARSHSGSRKGAIGELGSVVRNSGDKAKDDEVNDEDEEGEDEDEALASTFVGTQSYMSLERLRGDKYGAAADIWSLGVVLLEALLHAHPLKFCGGSLVGLMGTLTDFPPADGEEIATLGTLLPSSASVSEELRAFCNWTLAIPDDVRARPSDIIDDEWFALHFGDNEVLPTDQSAVRLRAAGSVQTWLSKDPTMVAYRGPANHAMSLDSLGGVGTPAIEAPRPLHSDDCSSSELDGASSATSAASSDETNQSKGSKDGVGGRGERSLGETLAQTIDSDED